MYFSFAVFPTGNYSHCADPVPMAVPCRALHLAGSVSLPLTEISNEREREDPPAAVSSLAPVVTAALKVAVLELAGRAGV